jgi:cyclopropane fatty-acyl-phospholipid synthase-like methyltransferase
VWREVFGDEYPAGLDPYSFVTVSELNRFSAELRVAEGDRLADLGCGRGGAGLWVAGKTGAQLIGIDISETALQAARSRASAMGVEHLAEFREGSFERTGLGSAFLDGVMSVDALLFAPDKAAALTELRRILRPNGRLVFTSWDYGRQPEKRPPQVDDHRPHLRAAGFDVLAYDETEDWHRRTLESGQGLLDHVEELALESGDDVGELRASIGEMLATVDAMTRRVLVVASAA